MQSQSWLFCQELKETNQATCVSSVDNQSGEIVLWSIPMVFNGTLVFVFITAIALWLAVLSVLIVRTRNHYNRLTRGISERALGEILEAILKRERRLSDRADKLEDSVQQILTDGAFHLSKVGLVRFNPFSDTGGTQSFTVAMLDSGNNGLVMTSLYGRTGNRWYVKEVKNGKGVGIELSKEESSALERAQNSKKHT